MKTFRIHLTRTVEFVGSVDIEAEDRFEAQAIFDEHVDGLVSRVDWQENDMIDQQVSHTEEV